MALPCCPGAQQTPSPVPLDSAGTACSFVPPSRIMLKCVVHTSKIFSEKKRANDAGGLSALGPCSADGILDVLSGPSLSLSSASLRLRLAGMPCPVFPGPLLREFDHLSSLVVSDIPPPFHSVHFQYLSYMTLRYKLIILGRFEKMGKQIR